MTLYSQFAPEYNAMPKHALFEYPLALKTVFAQLQQLVLHTNFTGPDIDLSAYPASGAIGIVSKTIKGETYWYAQYTSADGRRQQSYIGPQSDPKSAVIVEWLQTNEAGSDLRMRRQLVRTLKAAGYEAPSRHASGALLVLSRAGLFRNGVTLIGSPAYAAILNRLGVQESPALMTADLDVSVAPIELTLPEDVDIEAAFKHWNAQMFSVPGLRHSDPATSISMKKTDFMIDFLCPGFIDDEGTPKKLAKLGFAAAKMPFLDYLIKDAQPSLILTPNGLIAPIPNAAQFMIHKLAVAAGRPHAWASKRDKDIQQAATLYEILSTTDPDNIDLAVAAISEAAEPKAFTERIQRGIELAKLRGFDLSAIATS